MRHFFLGALVVLTIGGCSKTGKKFDNYQFPAHITGTVKSLAISYVDMEPAIPIGIFEINGADGRTYHFKFEKIDDLYLTGENCTMTLDTTMVLPQDAQLTDTSKQAQLLFKKSYLPNSVNIRFFDTADVVDTRGVKDVHATFGPETEVWADFLNYDDRPAYAGNRIKTIDKINAIIHAIKDHDPATPGDQPSRIVCQAYTY